MRSPAERRVALERLLRATAVLAMAGLAARLWLGSVAAAAAVVASAGLDSALVAWTQAAPRSATVRASTVPTPRQRDWLVALRRAGLPVAWRLSDSSGGAMIVESGLVAGAPSRVAVIAGRGRLVRLSDDLGPIDSAVAASGTVSWELGPAGPIAAEMGALTAVAAARDSGALRPVLVLSTVGWESRFVIAALEEAGWPIAARLALAPGVFVTQGQGIRIDTGSIGAVVVLDSLIAVDSRAITAFVRSGGGLLAAGSGTAHRALRGLLPEPAGRTGAIPGGLRGDSPRGGLSATTFSGAGGVVLGRREDAPVVVARRVGSGRTLAVGYDDTWRLRLVPDDSEAPARHRDWWSALVSGVAYARPIVRTVGVVDEAPLAAALMSLGPPIEDGSETPGRRLPWEAMLMTLALVSLLAEWTSRRTRGRP